ncbi:MAG TPA: PTS system mannose/fructose/sorbose family transporter subunit IID [Gemmatimonadaceae bacterium]|nr:PTS system mannose/fructose/sorbose family transporter subunit IID [Gemmatimonadaceae bacterium]
MTAAMPAATEARARSLPLGTWFRIYLRLFAVQGAWNYETLLGNGIAFCMEPALRLLPGGVEGQRYSEALGRQARYFNAHPYLAGVAVGALARAELDGVPAAMIERFRTALGGPLGSVGDRLVWASWLPLCSLVALGAFGAGGHPATVVVIFLALYNVGHFIMRAWGLQVGFERGLRVADALGHPVLRRGPQYVGSAAALLAGVAIPLAASRILGGDKLVSATLILAAIAGGLAFARFGERIEGWRLSLAVLALFVLFSVAI